MCAALFPFRYCHLSISFNTSSASRLPIWIKYASSYTSKGKAIRQGGKWHNTKNIPWVEADAAGDVQQPARRSSDSNAHGLARGARRGSCDSRQGHRKPQLSLGGGTRLEDESCQKPRRKGLPEGRDPPEGRKLPEATEGDPAKGILDSLRR